MHDNPDKDQNWRILGPREDIFPLSKSAKIRGFEAIEPWARGQYRDDPILPKRSTKNAAAYDFIAVHDAYIPPGGQTHCATNVKAYMLPDEVLHIHARSSYGIKKNLVLANTVGVIDSDYYSNPTNDGHIGIYLRNVGIQPVWITAGDKIAQGEFQKYLIADDDNEEDLPTRVGGTGSTGN